MGIGSIVLGIIVGGIFLTIWGGLLQNLVPIGIRSVREPDDTSRQEIGERIARLSTHGMYLVKHKVTALIAVRPESYYSPGRYLAIEALTQFLVAAVIVGLLVLTASLPAEQRILLILLAGLAGVLSSDAQNWNWWGFSGSYFIGLVLGRLAGYGILAVILTTLILRS
jgi:hypothetical protein